MPLVAALSADDWDIAGDNDDNAGTDNELIHGTNQIHDLAVRPGPVADEDWFRIGQKPNSSYEVVVDSTSGDIGFNLNLLQRVDNTGATLQNSVSTTPGLDYSHSLRWANATATNILTEFIRVGPGNCGTACGNEDVYQLRMRETTVSVARYNNAGSQITVLLVQNASPVAVNATVFYWSAAGALVATSTISGLAPHGLSVINTSTVGGLPGTSGSITIVHDAPYGQLNVKSVALEPSTGFSFDTPGVYRGY
jgi:hypothetical protein